MPNTSKRYMTHPAPHYCYYIVATKLYIHCLDVSPIPTGNLTSILSITHHKVATVIKNTKMTATKIVTGCFTISPLAAPTSVNM
uniref:Uncharacterized protein n=1 Tax=Solanum tuberosum TaxID=4113 RepID=M1BLC5_SOLTU